MWQERNLSNKLAPIRFKRKRLRGGNREKMYRIYKKRSLTSAAETSHALLLRHHSCDPKSFAHAQRGVAEKNSNSEAVMLWRVDRGEEGKNTTKDCNLYGYRNRGEKMTTGAQGITLKGSAELVADFFCKYFCGCWRCSCFSQLIYPTLNTQSEDASMLQGLCRYAGTFKERLHLRKTLYALHWTRDSNWANPSPYTKKISVVIKNIFLFDCI